MILIEGNTTCFSQDVKSIEINHEKVESCKNCEVGIAVNEKVRPNDNVYKINKNYTIS